MAHSKRNTSRPIFTSHERAMARAAWGSSSARLSRESFLPFASCWLCLEPAIDPVACSYGDIFCRECALSNILAQKKEIRRLEKMREQEERERLEEEARRDAEARERAIREFELTQLGLSIQQAGRETKSSGKDNLERSGPLKNGVVGESGQSHGEKRGEKRKFSLDADELARIAEEERIKVRKAIEEEKSSKPSLPFWAPAATPSTDSRSTEPKNKKTRPICPAAPEDNPHPYSLHSLITIKFTEETDSETKQLQRICPSCKKALTNASKAMLAKPCGHVLCRSCVGQFMKPSAADGTVRCFVCDTDVTEKPAKESEEKKEKDKIQPGLVELRREGTGFSAGGKNQVKKDTVSFVA